MARHILIAGGGFGGFCAARALERLTAASGARGTLVNDANFMLYTPLLPGTAGGTLDPRHVVVPLRSQLRRTELLIGSVTGAHPQARTLLVRRADGERLELAYDHLLVALGSVSRTLPIPGLAEHATGLEGFADPRDFAAQAIELYPRCRAVGMRWVLVEARERIMPEVPASLSAFAAHELLGRGIEIETGTTLAAVTARGATLSSGEQIPARTVVWTAGVAPSPVVASLGLPLVDGGRLAVDRELRVAGRPGVWAIGDCAAVPDPAKQGQACPPTAQHAIRQGRLAASNIAAALEHRPLHAFRYRTAGVVAELGHNKAVAITLGLRWRGLPAWLLARTYHLSLMPGFGRKL